MAFTGTFWLGIKSELHLLFDHLTHIFGVQTPAQGGQTYFFDTLWPRSMFSTMLPRLSACLSQE